MTSSVLQTRIDAARKARAQLAAYRPNDPAAVPPGLPRVLDAAEAVLKTVTDEIARDLAILQSSLQEIELPEGDPLEFERYRLLFLNFKEAVDQARRAAITEGFPIGPEDGGLPPAGAVPRVRIEKEVAALAEAVAGLRSDLGEIRKHAGQDHNRPEQNALIGFVVQRMEVKLALIDVKLADIIDLPGLSEAARGALRLARAFVNTLRSTNARVSGWLKETAARRLLPAAERMAGRVADVLSAAAKALSRPIPAPAERKEPDIDFLAIEQMIRRGEAPPQDVVPYVTFLTLDEVEDSQLKAIGHLRALRRLNIEGGPVSSLAPIANLSVLQALELDFLTVRDLGPLSGLTGLQSLSLEGMQISNLGPVSGLTGLQSLSVYGTQISDLGPLSGLTRLQSLSLNRTQVSDLSPLSGLTGLQSLSLYETRVSDLGPLSGLTGLQSLDLDGTQVSDLGPLSDLTRLQSLSLNRTQVSDLSPLSGLTGLQSLFLDGTRVSDLGPLSGLTGLQLLDLDGTQVSDLGPLSGLTRLQSLSLNQTQVSDLAPIRRLPGLRINGLFSPELASKLAESSQGAFVIQSRDREFLLVRAEDQER